MKSLLKYTLLFFLVLLVISSLISGLSSSTFGNKKEDIAISALVQKINRGEVQQITVRGEVVEIVLADGKTKEKVKKESGTSLSETLKKLNTDPAELSKISIVVDS